VDKNYYLRKIKPSIIYEKTLCPSKKEKKAQNQTEKVIYNKCFLKSEKPSDTTITRRLALGKEYEKETDV